MSSKIPYSLDDLLTVSNLGSLKRAQTNNLYGINHNAAGTLIRWNKDSQGYVFLTRPQLHLVKDNIRNMRKLYTLLGSNDLSIPSYVRNILDPRLAFGVIGSNGKIVDKTNCLAVDKYQVFIAACTNDAMTVSGFPEPAQSTFISKPGVAQESWGQVDGNFEIYHDFDIDITFRNTDGSPMNLLFYIWQYYADCVNLGKLNPYPDFIVENEIDYCTRIYRLVMNETKQYVTNIFGTGAAFPISGNIAQLADYDRNKPYSDNNRELTVRFKCFGAIYYDPILIKEFNESVVIFNPSMADGDSSNPRSNLLVDADGYDPDGPRSREMSKIPFGILKYFRNRGYPRINIDTSELEWYVPNDVFTEKVKALISSGLFDSSSLSGETMNKPFPK